MRSLLTIICVVTMLSVASGVMAYEEYGPDSCSTCHPGFVGGFSGPLHTAHLTFVPGCTSCHAVPGDKPVLLKNKCDSCHVGEGLRLHHVNDPEGPNCTQACHTDDGPPAAENVAPPLYGTSATTLTDSCADNLDNDGDLDTDAEDNDCTGTAVSGFSWTAFKSLFE